MVGARLSAAMRPRGAILRPLGDVIILMPPPAIDKPTLTRLLEVVEDTLRTDLPRIVGGL